MKREYMPNFYLSKQCKVTIKIVITVNRVLHWNPDDIPDIVPWVKEGKRAYKEMPENFRLENTAENQ